MNNLYLTIAVAAIICTVSPHYALAQEESGNEESASSIMLQLPFFDDFSDISTKPNPALWKNYGATVSTNLPNLPPSTGALMLDALDTIGNFYQSAQYGTTTAADTIESLPINLYYPDDNSIWLSYFYQRGGLGDRPEDADSLILDFYSPINDEWTPIKKYNGGKCTPFAQEMINIKEKIYLQEGFKFRFRNYISLGSSLAPDLVSNCDYWFIDYITLNKNRNNTDTVYNDVTLTNTPILKIGDYQQVPWQHYTSGKHENISYIINYRNNDRKARLLDSINLYLTHNGNTEKFELGTFNMPAYMDFENTNANLPYTIEQQDETSASISMKVHLVSDQNHKDYAANNTVTITKTLSDCYALDDGTAEAAYGLHGEGSDGAKVAIRFCPVAPGTINGVYMYFCPVYKNQQADNFNLKIWNCNNGLPLSEIFSLDNVVVPKDNTGKFVFIPFDETVEVRDTFFVGWQKNSTSIIAVGFDRNTSTPNEKYFNIGNVWKKSNEIGQIMIRPSFGDIQTATNDIESPKPQKATFNVYPNPASSNITIETSTYYNQPIKILIIDASTGRIVKTIPNAGNICNTDISDLATGIYIITSPQLGATTKILITK